MLDLPETRDFPSVSPIILTPEGVSDKTVSCLSGVSTHKTKEATG